mmetsp:Transcript_12335/g.26636  ORF Transcript_12335/g.26636 Transcript_12335/m.26636 type:complete len:302 (-) Transcript_12335:896-1801(-)|eukprot:CAMPEP_0202891978 /NCGR_PEP_ID=MMETSP1392-20130828/1863_1 /ASSEMBLY_ACC=CAM_ASM_000868 /TAXON_ID=225041 /ORGANISM="Chlamydomonas chlamydogama, Strain SAG 11-48b" /LENGTH=301 /DNA_ID=CAMNT_0049575853 /DNA_START=171 /DNA_END=1076 /DNA_ORIENTATION=-
MFGFSLMPLYGGGFWVAFTQVCAFYYFAGIVLHWVFPRILPVKNIQPDPRKPGVVARDAFYSIGPLAVKAAVWTCVEGLHARGWGLLYEGPVSTAQQVLYMVVVVVLMDYAHDTWFYLTHRLLHWKPLYRHVHYIHHKSNVPCAFTGYSFHVVEALIVFANEVLLCFVLPMHMGLHRVYHIITTAIHQAGHAGYEMAPFIPTVVGMTYLAARGTAPGPAPALNTVQHHDMHHRFPNKHFSLYFTHWDRWCGTMHSQYDQIVNNFFGTSAGSTAGSTAAQEQQVRGVAAGAMRGAGLLTKPA